MKKILVTGAGSGFGKFYSLSLAKRGFDVIAACELQSQITSLEKAAEELGLKLNVIKVDIADPADREYAARFDIDILVNNAGIGEGGAIVDIPEHALRRQIEVNYFSSIFLTQLFLRKFAHKKQGRVVFVSSVGGIISAIKNGAYCASKHAIEASAQAIREEMKDFNISIATINPGPYKTGFNDRLIEASNNWFVKGETVIDHSNPQFPMDQFPEDSDIEAMVDVIVDENSKFRNVFPLEMNETIKNMQKDVWTINSHF